MKLRTALSSVAVMCCMASLAIAQTKNPLENAKEGQWILQKSTAAGMTNYMYQWVSKVDGKKITLRTQVLNQDQKTAMMAGTDAVIDLGATAGGSSAPASGPAPKISDDEVELKGKKVKCKKIEVAIGPSHSTSWISEEVPISGLVKAVTTQDGKEVAKVEVVDFGMSGGADKPVGAAGAPPATPDTPSTPSGPAAAHKFAAGDKVAAKWKDGHHYSGTIAAAHDGKFDINYDDGDKHTVAEGDIVLISDGKNLATGDHVWAEWKDKRWYQGVLTSKTEHGFNVKWDDGSPELDVPIGKIGKN